MFPVDLVNLFWCSLSGVVITGSLLVIARFSAPTNARQLTGWAGGLLFALAAGLSPLAPVLAVAIALQAGLACLVWLSQLAIGKRLAGQLTHPVTIWGLGVGTCLTATLLLGMRLQQPPEHYIPRDRGAAVESETVAGVAAVTDLGRVIPLVRYTQDSPVRELEAEFLGDRQYENVAIRLSGPNHACNCHGWVFTGGRFGIRGRDIFTILEENGYQRVDSPVAGDLIIYDDGQDTATHTGVVRIADENGLVLIESKWGPLGVFLHQPPSQPFGQRFAYYRSDRPNHLLKLELESSEDEAAPGFSTAKEMIRRAGPMGVQSAKVRSRQS